MAWVYLAAFSPVYIENHKEKPIQKVFCFARREASIGGKHIQSWGKGQYSCPTDKLKKEAKYFASGQ